jgi:hypothetical protein
MEIFISSAVGIASGYGLDDRQEGVWVPVGSRIFTSSRRPNRLWGPPMLLYNVYRRFFPEGKAAGAWSWPLTSSQCRSQENVDLYIHSSIRPHGIVLIELSRSTTLPLPLWEPETRHSFLLLWEIQIVMTSGTHRRILWIVYIRVDTWQGSRIRSRMVKNYTWTVAYGKSKEWNRKFWQYLIACFPLTTSWVFYTTRIT